MLVDHKHDGTRYQTWINDHDIIEMTQPVENPYQELTVKTIHKTFNFKNVRYLDDHFEELETQCEIATRVTNYQMREDLKIFCDTMQKSIKTFSNTL